MSEREPEKSKFLGIEGKTWTTLLAGAGIALVGLDVTDTLPFEVQWEYIKNAGTAFSYSLDHFQNITDPDNVARNMDSGMGWAAAVDKAGDDSIADTIRDQKDYKLNPSRAEGYGD